MLNERDVHVWWCGVSALERPGVRAACHALMNAQETARHDRLLVARVRDEFLLTRGLCRAVLSHYAPHVAPKDWAFASNPFGRPHIVGPALSWPLHFNLTNTAGLAAIAVTRLGYEVGIDVENITRAAEMMALAQRNFSPQEAAHLAAQPPGEQRRTFFAYWTLKEAYIKARGMGMSIPLDQFNIDLDASPERLHFAAGVQDDGAAWQLALHAPTPDHMLAWAIRRGQGDDVPVHVREGLPL